MYKGSPLIRRRAPAPNTVNRKGSPDGWLAGAARASASGIRGRFAVNTDHHDQL